MEYLGEHNKREVYWWNFWELYEELPGGDWVCFAMIELSPAYKVVKEFVRHVIQKKVLEFKAHGNFSEQLHDIFDETVVVMEELENYPKADVMTTWHDKEGLASSFWQCFHATCLPGTTNYDNLKIVCLHFDKRDRRLEIKSYLQRFNEGWIPSDKE